MGLPVATGWEWKEVVTGAKKVERREERGGGKGFPPPPYDTATTATEVRLHLYGALPESKVQPDYILQLKAEGVYMYPGDTKFTTDAWVSLCTISRA